MRNLKIFIVALAVAFLTACGGGGGSAGMTTTSGGDGTVAGTGTGTPTVVVSTPTLVVGLFNSAGAAVSGVSVGGGFVARATVKDAAGVAVAARLVTFSLAGPAIASLNPATALTNASGVAEVAIAPASVASTGAATVIASASVAGIAVTGQTDFSVQAASLSLSAITLGSSNIDSGGNTAVQVSVNIGSAVASGVPVNVSFSVSCGRINAQDTAAGGVSVTTNGSGVSSAVYDAVAANGTLCTGPVVLTAATSGAPSKTTTLTVAAPKASAVVFLAALPAQVFLAGSGAMDQATVNFKVLSSTGVALPSVDVKFSIVTNPGGVGIGSAGSLAPVTKTTLANGEASITVFSGTIPGPVKLRAELVSSPFTFAESQNLTVASGPPSQRFMSFAVETSNIEGWNRDGTPTQLTVRIADRQGNAVDDGTVISFTAEGGQVARSCATARVAGISQCTVNFVSQNPRPAGGRVSVLAFTEGTKDYVDTDSNNRFNPDDTLINIGDAYRNDDERGNIKPGDFSVPRGVSGGTGCIASRGSFPSAAGTCNNELATTVRQQAVILFSSSSGVITATSVTTGDVSFTLASADNRLLPMPAGTTIAADASSGSGSCVVDKILGSPVVNVSPGDDPDASLITSHAVTLKGCTSGNSVTVRVTSPAGLTTIFPTFILP
jgi:hypothetical protein